jgi:hypothetical protein
MSVESGLKIKGSVIKDPRNWMMKNAYGPEAFQSALGKLTAEERSVIEGPLLAGAWYPIQTWDRFLAAMRDEARARRGHSDAQFNMRNMREAGSTTARTIYKFVLGLMSARSVVEKVVVVMNRVYSEGHAEIIENVAGRAVIRYCDCSPDLRLNLSNNFMYAFLFLLELNGANCGEGSVTRDEVVDGKLVYEVTLTYNA